MRKKLIAVALSISMALGGINSTTTYADSKLTKVNILQNKGDTTLWKTMCLHLKKLKNFKHITS